MEMISRYRGYTSYSEENGKLVPSIEPYEKDVKIQVTEEQIKKSIEDQKKLKPIDTHKIIAARTTK
jgi:negative regulator of genetic competence, sporulation and motility